jgi:hypothetical protein
VAIDGSNLHLAQAFSNLSSANDGFGGLNGQKRGLKDGGKYLIFINSIQNIKSFQ